MVKGISRQVIVMNNPEQKIFDQVIFILKEDALGDEGVTDRQILQEAKKLAGSNSSRKGNSQLLGPLWACAGAMATGVVWFLWGLI